MKIKITLKNNDKAKNKYSVFVEGHGKECRFSSAQKARKYVRECFDYDTNEIEVIDEIIEPVKKIKFNRNWK
jgi:nicotinamide mononucleotide adenylyltransferase